jgi:hypothetical protein
MTLYVFVTTVLLLTSYAEPQIPISSHTSRLTALSCGSGQSCMRPVIPRPPVFPSRQKASAVSSGDGEQTAFDSGFQTPVSPIMSGSGKTTVSDDTKLAAHFLNPNGNHDVFVLVHGVWGWGGKRPRGKVKSYSHHEEYSHKPEFQLNRQ